MDYQAIALIEAYKKLIQLKDEKVSFYERKLDEVMEKVKELTLKLEIEKRYGG